MAAPQRPRGHQRGRGAYRSQHALQLAGWPAKRAPMSAAARGLLLALAAVLIELEVRHDDPRLLSAEPAGLPAVLARPDPAACASGERCLLVPGATRVSPAPDNSG